MKFTNKKSFPLYKGGYVILGVVLLSFLGYNCLISDSSLFQLHEIGIFTLLVILGFVYWYKRAKHIEYDSTGLCLVFISKGLLFSEINNYREQRIEIPKSKLKKFHIKNAFFSKKLYLYIKTHGVVKKVCLDITFLSNNKIKALKMSLDKVVQENSSSK
ncbi:MAG: hypothetical protein COA88_10165 [Kordia sp.]|nr:MAG: hypothetical protein COA88_10165 [Kordia sp.]